MRPCARKFDGLANSLGDRAQIPLICLQFLLGGAAFRHRYLQRWIPYQRTRLLFVQLFGCTRTNQVLSETCACAPSARSRRIHLQHIEAVNQYNAFILAVTQKSYDLNVHKSDFAQVEDRGTLSSSI